MRDVPCPAHIAPPAKNNKHEMTENDKCWKHDIMNNNTQNAPGWFTFVGAIPDQTMGVMLGTVAELCELYGPVVIVFAPNRQVWLITEYRLPDGVWEQIQEHRPANVQIWCAVRSRHSSRPTVEEFEREAKVVTATMEFANTHHVEHMHHMLRARRLFGPIGKCVPNVESTHDTVVGYQNP